MKNINAILIFLGLILLPVLGFCQNQPPTGAANGNANYNDWFRGGNVGLVNGTTPNKIGSFWNSPMYFYTNGNPNNQNDNTNLRMKINPTFTGAGGTNQYPINGYGWAQNVNTSGYVGIGTNDPVPGGAGLLWTNKGPFSMLHLNGDNINWSVQETGYRPWMKIGMTVTAGRDLMYVGNRSIAPDITESVFVWSDNAYPPVRV